MLLRDAIKYLELTKCDFITDLSDFAKLQKDYIDGFVSDTFTEDFEGFTDKLFILWANSSGGVKKALEANLELPSATELIQMYCNVIFTSDEVKEEDENTSFFSSDLIKRKKDNVKNNRTLDLLTFLGNNEINIGQYLDIELDVVFKVIDLIIEQKKEEEKKRKNKKRGL